MNRRIKDGIVGVLQGITYDTGSGPEPAFVSVLDNTKDEFQGYPSVRVLPNDFNSEPGEMSQRDHTPSFTLILHLPLESASEIESATYDQMYDLTDLIVDALEHADYEGTLNGESLTHNTWRLVVPQVSWFVATGKAGALLLCNIDVEVSYSKNVN